MEDDIHETIKEEAADKETATEEEMMALRTHFLFALSNREEEGPVSRSCKFHFCLIFLILLVLHTGNECPANTEGTFINI